MKWFVIGLVGLGIVVVGLYVLQNLKTEPTMTVDQQQADENKERVIAESAKPSKKGSFEKIDVFHMASGEAVVYQTSAGSVLQFENFSITPGPDLFVYLTKTSLPSTLSPELGEFVSLGNLKATSGLQAYSLPADGADFQTVVIWCRAFGVQFSQARLI